MNDTTLVPPPEPLTKLQRARTEMYFTCGSPPPGRVMEESGMRCSRNRLLAHYPNFCSRLLYAQEWPRVYKALQDGKIDIALWRKLWGNTLLSLDKSDKSLLIAIDTSNIRRNQ